MKNITSEGHGWELVSQDDGKRVLTLKCPYGTIEIVAVIGDTERALFEAGYEYNRLKAMGPLETGRKGYKMSKITAIEVRDEQVAIVLACGHTVLCYPYGGLSVEEYAQSIQQGIGRFEIGVSRVKCEQHQDCEVSA